MDLTGQRFGRLLVIKKGTRVLVSTRIIPYWLCLCDCGNMKSIYFSNIKLQKTVSCWCFRKKRTDWELRLLHVFYAIKDRCKNTKNKAYKNYWGRWIKCEWGTLDDFYRDMWDSYVEWLTIDRIDNDWNYCKENCRWETRKENQRNRRVSFYIDWEHLMDYCKRLWLNYWTIYTRVSRWSSMSDAIEYIKNKHYGKIQS